MDLFNLENKRETTLVTEWKRQLSRERSYKKNAKIFINSKDAVTMVDINQFKGHTGGAFHGIFVFTRRAKTAVAAKRNEFEFSAMSAGVHVTAKRRITTVAIFDIPAFLPERKICLLGRSPLLLRSVLDVRHRRTAPSKPGLGPTWPEESLSLCSLC